MARNEKMAAVLDLRGLDMVTPVDLLSDGRTPYSKNFRLYAQQSDDRRVAVSSRKGPGFHTTPIGETLSDSNTSSVGASTAKVGVISGIQLIPLTGPNNGLLTRFDIKVSDPEANASGPLLIQIYEDKDGKPGRLMTESSILGGDIGPASGWKTARFVKAAALQQGSNYWAVIRMQDDGKNQYSLDTTEDGALAWSTDSALFAAQEQDYAINYRLYTTPGGQDKGVYRFNRDNGQNVTVAVYGDTIYQIDEANGELKPIIGGLSPDASEYSFTNGDNKVFWVNGHDELTNWDGTVEESADNILANPTFEVSTVGWTATGGGSGNAITRNTSDFQSAPASLQVNATSGLRSARQTVMMYKNRRYKVSYWAKGVSASGNTQFAVNGSTTPVASSVKPITAGWAKYEMYYTPGDDVTNISFQATGTNFFLDTISIIDTGIEYIIDEQLPILSQVIMHKDRLFGVDAADPNRIVFSENPGNPAYDPTGKIPTTARQQWYYEWLSVSFWYVPRPHNGSPITKLVSFQDALTIFTQDNKYVLSGYDRGSLFLRQSTGNKGAISARGVVNDENRIYFVSSDGLYEHDGSSDKKLSGLVNPLLDGCPRLRDITPVLWKNQVRFYMASQGSPVNDVCLIYDKDVQEMVYDTDTFVNRAVWYDDADDDQQLIELSSLVPVSYLGEVNYHSLGAPIDFEYRLKYDSMKTPMQRKRLKRFYPILQGVDTTFNIQLAMDKDFEDSPRIKDQLMTTNGAKVGEFKLGDGTILGGDKSFKPKRQSYSGYAYYWQLRVKRKGVNNRVAFIGAQFSYKTKRL